MEISYGKKSPNAPISVAKIIKEGSTL
jgi:hypothetical protein